jgi:hypothetical protein
MQMQLQHLFGNNISKAPLYIKSAIIYQKAPCSFQIMVLFDFLKKFAFFVYLTFE